MKILHLYSDWKWTGPAEPVLQMCQGLQGRGHEVLIAYCARARENYRESVDLKVREMGLHGTTAFALDRYLHPGPTWRDFRTLPGFLRREKFDVVHMHLDHDHVEGALCARWLGQAGPLLVRTLHRREVLPAHLGYRFLLGRMTDGWLTFTENFRQDYIQRFRLPAARTAVQPMTVDLERFRPDKPWRDMRAEFSIAGDSTLIGIVGRYQKYRKMDIFLAAAQRVLQEAPQTRFFVIGRSSQIQKTVVEPAAALGISDKIILTGYRTADYADLMAALDIFSLLMPGFDGTARAVREAMALGKPCVVSDFGMLPDIVPHEKAGLVVRRDDPEALAQAWLALIRDPARRRELGQGARREAETRFGVDRVGPALEDFYERLLTWRRSR